MDIGVAVRLGRFGIVDLGQPVVRRDRARVGQDQAAHGVRDGGVLFHAPVFDLEVAVHELFVVEQRVARIAHVLALAAVQNVGLGHVGIARFGKHLFDAVLDLLDADQVVFDPLLEMRRHVEGQHVDDRGMVILLARLKRLGDGRRYLRDVEGDDGAVALDDLVHGARLSLLMPSMISARK